MDMAGWGKSAPYLWPDPFIFSLASPSCTHTHVDIPACACTSRLCPHTSKKLPLETLGLGVRTQGAWCSFQRADQAKRPKESSGSRLRDGWAGDSRIPEPAVWSGKKGEDLGWAISLGRFLAHGEEHGRGGQVGPLKHGARAGTLLAQV